MVLTTNVVAGQVDHPGLHNEERSAINALQSTVGTLQAAAVTTDSTSTSPTTPLSAGAAQAMTDAKIAAAAVGGGALDMTKLPYTLSTTNTAAANAATMKAAIQAAGRRGVTAPPGRYRIGNLALTNEEVVIDAPGATFCVSQGNDYGIEIERTLGTAYTVGPTRVVNWGPNLPGGVSSSAKYTAIDLTSGNYQNWKSGDIIHISSQDAYPWSWSGQNITDYSTSSGLYWQAEYLPLLGIGILVTTANGGPQEQMVVQGSTSGAVGLVASDLVGNASGGITASQQHVMFASVTGDFVAGETLTRITGGNPNGGASGAAVGVAVGTVVGAPFLVSNELLLEQYGVVTAANISAGGTYGAGTRYPNRTDNTVRIRKMDRTPVCSIRTNFDIDGVAGAQDAYTTDRPTAVRLRAVYGPQVDVNVVGSWTRCVMVTSCYGGTFKGRFDGLANHAYLDQNAFGYGFELKCASKANRFQFFGRNLRHAFTTNPNGRTFSTTDTSHVDYGTPKYNTVHDSKVHASLTNSFDTHPGDHYTTFIDCEAIGGGSGGRFNSDGGAQFASRGFGTRWINCKSENSVEGINWLGPEHDPGFNHTAVVQNCEVLGYQSRGFFAVDSVTSRASVVIDGGRFVGDGSATNSQYQHEGLAIGKGLKVTIKGEAAFGGFNGVWLRMREAGTAGFQSELDIVSAFVDYRGTTTGNAQSVRVDGTLARAVIGSNAIVLRLADGTTPGGLIRNVGGNTAYGIGHVVTDRTLPLFQTTGAGGSPTSAALVDIGLLGLSSGGSGGGTTVTVDGVPVSTLDISSTPAVQVFAIGADVASPAASTTISNLSQFQTTLDAGSYVVEAELYYTSSVVSAGALRFGLGGPGAGGASITNVRVTQYTSTTAESTGFQNVLGTAGATATTTAGSSNVVGLSAGVAATTLPVILRGRILVTTAGTLGLMWGLSNGATTTAVLKAGSHVTFTKAS